MRGRFFSITCSVLFLFLCFAGSVVAVAQNPPNQARQGYPAAGIQSTSILGIVSEYGDKLRFVTDQRAWNVDNPEMLEGHEGHYIRVNAQIYPDKGSIHIIEVKMPTASEIRKNDVR